MDKTWDSSRLSTGERSELKRNAGKKFGDDMRAMEVFYRACTYGGMSAKREEICFSMACLECMWRAEDHPTVISMEELLCKWYNDPETSNSGQRRIVSLMDIEWGEDGYLLGKLHNVICICKSKWPDIMPDFEALANDLMQWNSGERYVQRRWLRTICMRVNIESEMGETFNVD